MDYYWTEKKYLQLFCLLVSPYRTLAYTPIKATDNFMICTSFLQSTLSRYKQAVLVQYAIKWTRVRGAWRKLLRNTNAMQ